jgi:hypothetical protein
MIIFGINFSTADLWLLGICGALFMAWVSYRLTLAGQRHNAFIIASSIFRNIVLTELTGLYPIDQLWDKKEFPRLYQSIPKINSAAAEFRYFVTRKTDFDKAVRKYCNYCRNTKESNAFGLEYKDMGVKGTQNYRNEFKNIVENMIAFTNEK